MKRYAIFVGPEPHRARFYLHLSDGRARCVFVPDELPSAKAAARKALKDAGQDARFVVTIELTGGCL